MSLSQTEGLTRGKITQSLPDSANGLQFEVEFKQSDGTSHKAPASAYGLRFLPQKGDQVILGFIDNNPELPVILGCMSCRENTPVYSRNDSVHTITSNGNIQIIIDDKNHDITIKTPANNRVVVSDAAQAIRMEDQHRNVIEMNRNGITIVSSKELVLKSQQGIKIDSGTTFDVKAKSDLIMEGMNIQAKAKVEIKLNGSASAELSASGKTIVKGGIVMIN